MSKEYFGKGCTYFTGQWENTECYEDDRYKGDEPVLNHCIHVDNKCTTEGNCNKRDCPINTEEWMKQFKNPSTFRSRAGKENYIEIPLRE